MGQKEGRVRQNNHQISGSDLIEFETKKRGSSQEHEKKQRIKNKDKSRHRTTSRPKVAKALQAKKKQFLKDIKTQQKRNVKQTVQVNRECIGETKVNISYLKWNKYVELKLKELEKSRKALLDEEKASRKSQQNKNDQEEVALRQSYLQKFRAKLNRRSKPEISSRRISNASQSSKDYDSHCSDGKSSEHKLELSNQKSS